LQQESRPAPSSEKDRMHRGTVGNAAICLMTALAAGDGRQGAPQPAGDPPAAAGSPDPLANGLDSIEAVISAFYSAGAGEGGRPRDWEAFKGLFLPEARVIVARAAGRGNPEAFLTVTEHIEQNARVFERGGYFDREIAQRAERFGNVAHVWSTFETRRIGDGTGAGLMRGINSFQLLRRQERWWIASVLWELERKDNPIPPEYAGKP
jgi:hypothetical protein